MKKLTLLFFLFLLQISFSQTEWFASPTGTPTGNGTIANPWDLQTAFTNASNAIQPGHILWLRGGIYTGRFEIGLIGNSSNRITIQSYPGEKAILNGNINSPTPPISNPGLLKRIRKFIWSLSEEEFNELWYNAKKDPNTNIYNGINLDTELPDPYVLTVDGASFVDFKNFEITCIGMPTRIQSQFTNPNQLVGGLFSNNSPFCRFIELVIYDNTSSGVSTWKYSAGEEYHNCLIFNNGSQVSTICSTSDCPELNTGYGPGFYIQNITNFEKLLKGNAVFNNFKNSIQIFSASTSLGTVFDYVKNVDIINSTIFNAGNPMPGTYSPYKSHKPEILISTFWSGIGNSNIPKNVDVIGNTLYQNTNLDFASTSGYGTTFRIGESAAAPAENINILNNKFFGRHEVLELKYAKNSLQFKNNLVFGRTVFHNTNNPTNCDITNWDFTDNNYYNVESGRVFKDWAGPQRSILQWQTDFTIDTNSFRFHQDSFQTTNSIKQFTFAPNKYLITIINDTNNTSYNTINFTTVSGFSIPIGTPYRIIDVENYHAEVNSPFSNTYTGAPISFNMQSTAFEAPSAHVTSTPKTPTNFGCFIIEFDLCSNTTAALNLPTQTCTTAGALTNLAQYVTGAPTTGTFTGTGVQQVGSEYVFNASLTGIGTHTITYTFQNSAGCPFISITDTITVTDCPQKPYISQTYYNGSDKFIEIKNSSDTQNINAGNYYLALFENNEATNVAPTKYINLGAIAPQSVKVWKAQTGGNLGYVTATDWLDLNSYDGVDDILILTSTIDANAYANRLDEFGKANFNSFNDNITLQQQPSFVRMSCAPAIPTPIYNQEHWVYFTGAEVGNSMSKTNAELGRHFDKPLIWEMTNTWNETDIPNIIPIINESYPERSRSLVFANDYCTGQNLTNTPITCPGPGYGSFEACALELGTGVTLTINPLTYIKVFTSINATASGSSLITEDKGSLVMVYDCYNGTCGIDLIDLGAVATMQTDKQTVGINGPYDYVYWSSPLSATSSNPTINQVFPFGTANGQFNPNRFYIFENANFYDQLATYGNNGSGTDGYDDNFDDYNPLNTIAEQTASFIPGRGYATWPPINDIDGYNVSFTGEMNNGEVTVPVFRNNSVNGANPNLVGNPYPSAIDLDVLFAENANLIEPLAFIWGRAIIDDPSNTNTGPNQLNYQEDNYQIYNPTMIIDPVFNGNTPFNSEGILASCQSFFIRTKDPVGGYTITNTGLIEQAGDLVFKNKMRTTAPNTTFARMSSSKNSAVNSTNIEQNDKLWVNLSDNSGYTAQLGIAFLTNGNASYLLGEDVSVINGRKYNFFTQSTQKDLIIDVQDAFNESKVIPLGITNTSTTSQIMFSISIPKKEGIFNSQTVYLYDALLNTYHNLSNGAYNFTTNAAIIENRFSLVFTTINSNFTKQVTGSDVKVYAENNTIRVLSKGNKIENVEVHDIYTANTSGVLICKKEKIHAEETELSVSNSYRLLNVTIQLEDGSIIIKKIMK